MSDVKVDLPSSWVKFKPSLCEGCWAGCCTLPVEVTTSDLIRMELVSEDEARDSVKKMSKRLMREGIVKSFRVGTGIFILEQHPNGDCRYLDGKRRCSIYEKRPETCRNFPRIGPRSNYCPSFKA